MAVEDDLTTCVVLGGRNFVGRSLVLRLLSLGNWIVRVADSAQSFQLDLAEQDSLLSHAFSTERASYFNVDVRNKNQLIKAIQGSSVVFHVDDGDSCRDDFFLCYTVIVQGVKNVINACRECKVKRLIYNSTADVVFDGAHDIHDGDESLPYAWKFDNTWGDLKAQAEALVLFANDIDGLLTCALRPSNVFGPGDKQLVPSLIDIATSGWAKFIIGSGENMSDFTYVENVAHALVCAEEALGSRMVSISGKVFFITNVEPMKFWDFVTFILEGLGYQRPMIKLPARMIMYTVLLVKWMHSQMNSRKLNHAVGIQNVVQLASCTRTFNCAAAQKHIGYTPIVSVEEGVKLTIDSFPHLSEALSFMMYKDFGEPSKVEKLLGGGTVSDILLWRDENKSFTYFLVLALLYYWFFLCGRTFVSSAAKLLLLIATILFGYGFLPSNISGLTIPRISPSCFEISEVEMKNSATSAAHLWKRMIYMTRSLAQGEDWYTFFKVAVPLYFFKLYVLHSLTAAIGVALVLAFTSFFVYEQYEEEIDGIAEFLLNITRAAVTLLLRNLPLSVASLLSSNDMLHLDEKLNKPKEQR